MNPFLQYLQTSGEALGRGARALNQYVDPWQYLDPKTVAGFAPGGGVVQGNQDILAAKEAWGQGDYPRAIGLGAQSALNTGLDLLPMTAMLPAVTPFQASVAKSKEHLAQTGDYLAGLEKELQELIGSGKTPLPEASPEQVFANLKSLKETGQPATSTLGATPEMWKVYDEVWGSAAEGAPKGYQGGISGAPKEDWSVNPAPLEQVPWTEADQAKAFDWNTATPEQIKAAGQQQHYTDVVEASFGDMEKGKAYYSEIGKKNIMIEPEEEELISNLWPDLWASTPWKVMKPLEPLPPPEPLPGPSKPMDWWDTAGEQRSRRLLYEDKAVGPPVPQRDLPMDPASVAQRQKAGDYWPETLYTGVPTWGDVPARGFTDPQAINPNTKRPFKDERAIFLSNEPPIAETYATGHSGAHGPIFPVKARMQSPREVDWESWAGTPHFANEDMKALIDESIEQGYDSAIVRDMIDQGSYLPQTQYLVFSPNQLRSIYAKFDPKNIEANDLMAGIAAAFGLGAVAKSLPEEAK